MFAMLNFRITAALAALQVFIVTVLWADGPWLFGAVVGAVNAAVLVGFGRSIMAARTVTSQPQATRAVYLAALGGFLVQLALGRLLLANDRAVLPTLAVLGAALALIVVYSLTLNRLTRSK